MVDLSHQLCERLPEGIGIIAWENDWNMASWKSPTEIWRFLAGKMWPRTSHVDFFRPWSKWDGWFGTLIFATKMGRYPLWLFNMAMENHHF